MKKTIIFIFYLLAIQSCSTNKSTENNTSTPQVNAPELSLICQAESSKIEGTPAHSVHLDFNGKKIKLADILACETFDKKDYTNFQMPKNTMQAIGGWWAGAGEYFYLIQNQDGSYAVNYGQMYEEKETKLYDYTELVRVKKDDSGKWAAHPKHELNDLVGVYTLGGHDSSWMLVIKPKNGSVEATYYPIDGMLPPADFLKENPIPGKGQTLKNFNVDFSDMVINSEIGSGQLEVIFGRERITFFEVKSHQEDMLRVTKDESLAFLTK